VNIFSEQYVGGPPGLVVEVLSPSTRVRDRTTKLRLSARTGVAEHWLVDPERSAVTVHVLLANGEYQGLVAAVNTATSVVLPELKIDLKLLFRDLG